LTKKIFYDARFSILVGLCLLVLLRVVSTPTANLSFFILAAYATSGRSQAIRALGITWFFTMVSPGIAPDAPLSGIGRYAVFLGASVGVFIRSGVLSGRLKASKLVVSVIALGVFIIIHSLIVSPVSDVSVLKGVSWMLVIATLLSAWSGLTPTERATLFRQLYLGLVAIMIISLPLLISPIGYLKNGTGFQGVLNHPQALGPTMAILGAIAASSLFSERKPSWSFLSVFGVSVILIMASEARTAGIALLIGLGTAIAIVSVISGRSSAAVLPGLKSRRLWGVIGVTFCLSLIFAPQIGQKYKYYISKSDRAGSVENIADAYFKSRGGLIERMLVNINENPLSGIGFGVASESELIVVERDSFLGLPISAPVEKGVLPLILIEELGLIGVAIFFAWLLYLVFRAGRRGVVNLAVLMTVIVINFGEGVFFSPGGLGMLVLVVLSWSVTGCEQS